MVPESEDNYSGDFCSILCLKTTPTVVVLATRNGVIHHCIVLEDEDVQDGNEEVRVCVFHMWRILFKYAIYLCTEGFELQLAADKLNSAFKGPSHKEREPSFAPPPNCWRILR